MNTEEIICGNLFKSICDDFIDESKPFINLNKKPKTIFCFTDWVEMFILKVLPHIDYEFNFVTHNADHPITNKYLNLLESTRLKKWYGMNCHIEHQKLFPLPIGIANEKWPHGNKQILDEVINKDIKKHNLVYSNFQVHTNPVLRNKTLQAIKNKSFIFHEEKHLEFKKYLEVLKSYKYVISPAGNSIDCHRIWEALYLGVIPIVEHHIALKSFYELPILVVNNFEELQETDLNVIYEDTISRSLNKAKFSYYKSLLLSI